MTTTTVQTGTQWRIDPAHSEVSFKIKHLMITNVKGVFTKYHASVAADTESPITSDVTFTIEPASINTGDVQRDQHLKSADFFDVETFDTIRFKGKSLQKISADTYKLLGDLTIKGVTKPVTFEVEYGGLVKDPWGNQKAGLSVQGIIHRNDFGLNFNATLETGGLLLGEEVKISADLQLLKQ